MRDRYRAHLRQREAKFRARHLGAERATGSTGRDSYPYIAYHESHAAAVLELCSVLSVIFGMGLMIVLPTEDSAAWSYLAWVIGLVLLNRMLALLARIVNDVQVRHKISTDAEYARYFAAKYPGEAQLCAELNEIYALNPDAVPPEQILAKRQPEPQREARFKRIITAASLSFLLLMFFALMAFCVWAMKENI